MNSADIQGDVHKLADIKLADIQRDVRAHLLTGHRAATVHVRGEAASRLHVYHHAYRAQLAAALRDTYEKTWAWLGDARFEAAVQDYVEHHPPCSWTLNDYGDRFADSLKTGWPEDPEIADLARLEHALRRAFDGADAAPVDAAALAQLDWETAVLRFAPTLQLLPVATNAAAIWSALEAGQAPPVAAPFGPAMLRVWRQDLLPKFSTVVGHEQEALRLALSGVPFGAICAAMAAALADDDAASVIGGLLTSWLRDGLIVGVD